MIGARVRRWRGAGAVSGWWQDLQECNHQAVQDRDPVQSLSDEASLDHGADQKEADGIAQHQSRQKETEHAPCEVVFHVRDRGLDLSQISPGRYATCDTSMDRTRNRLGLFLCKARIPQALHFRHHVKGCLSHLRLPIPVVLRRIAALLGRCQSGAVSGVLTLVAGLVWGPGVPALAQEVQPEMARVPVVQGPEASSRPQALPKPVSGGAPLIGSEPVSRPFPPDLQEALAQAIARLRGEIEEIAALRRWQADMVRIARTNREEARRLRRPMAECRASVLAPLCDALGDLFAETGAARDPEAGQGAGPEAGVPGDINERLDEAGLGQEEAIE